MSCEEWEWAIRNETFYFSIDTWCLEDPEAILSKVPEEYHLKYCPFCGSKLDKDGCNK